MKTTNTVHPRKTTVEAAKTRKAKTNHPSSAHSIAVSPTTITSSSNLPQQIRFSRTRLQATTTDASEGESTTRFFGVVQKRLVRFLSREDSTSKTETLLPEISPIEPYLHKCPDVLHRYYRPLPRAVRAMTVGLSTFLAVSSTNWKKMLPTVSLFVVRQIALTVLKTVTYILVAQVVLQDTLFASKRPSRVTMKTLVQKYFLPSTLSKYEPITVEPPPILSGTNATTIENTNSTKTELDDEPVTLGVHYLQYDNGNDAKQDKNEDSTATDTPKRSFSAMYFQHGFGASSLSWLPVLPKLAEQLNARVALGHDTVGFGFTDRPKDGRWYRPKQAARIAEAILARERPGTFDETPKDAAAKPVCLFGHSMGSRATLRLATQLPAETPKLIVLSSPALGLIAPKSPRAPPSSTLAKTVSFLSRSISSRVLNPTFKYILRRVVGTNGSWRKGLEGAWGDPRKVTEDSDVLRYSWPSIGYGWEDGILKFAGAQVLPKDDELDDDLLLMRSVLQLPHTKVLIVLGSKDMVIPTRSVERFLERVVASSQDNIDIADIAIVEMEGLGHCAFEEDRETFCAAVEQLVRDNWDTLGYC